MLKARLVRRSSTITTTTMTMTMAMAITSPSYRNNTHRNRKEVEEEVNVRTPLPSTSVTSVRWPRMPRCPPLALPSLLCNALDDLINTFLDPPLRRHPSVDPARVLSGNFAPVTELPPTPCPVVRGSIPPCLRGGAYVRNGPNPHHRPRGEPHHLFDGDGMLHSLLLLGDQPTLSSRHVRTYRYLLERRAGRPVLPSLFSHFRGPAGILRAIVSALRVLTGQMDPLTEGLGTANTSLIYFAGQLFALGEPDLPYALHLCPDSGDISTLGRCDFAIGLLTGMTAHPKKDPSTGELFAFRYGLVPPYLTYFRFDRDGSKAGPDVPIFSMCQPTLVHDFAVTERYAVFLDVQVVMRPPAGAAVNRRKVPRLGLLPRYAESGEEMRWFEVPGFNAMHMLNAWDEEEAVVVVAVNLLSVEHVLERTELVRGCVEMVRIELRGEGTSAVTRTVLSRENLELGVINPGWAGRRNRYAYVGVLDPMPKIAGVVKLDLGMAGKGVDCVVARREFGAGCFGGEPFFVPATAAAEGEGCEDEGYLVTYVHDERSGESRFVVMDARSPGLEIVAEVVLPRRVPYGFHGLFLPQSVIKAQRDGHITLPEI